MVVRGFAGRKGGHRGRCLEKEFYRKMDTGFEARWRESLEYDASCRVRRMKTGLMGKGRGAVVSWCIF